MKLFGLFIAASVIMASVLVPAAALTVDRADNSARIAPAIRSLPIHESLTFRVTWLGVRVGTITASINGIKNINGREAYECEAIVKTGNVLSRIYPINDRYLSYMDVEKLYTLRHEVYRREGRYKKDAITDFDQVGHKAYFRNLLDGSKKVVEIPPGVQDSLSAVHYFRMVDVKIDAPIAYSVYNNEQVYELFAVADRIKRIRVPGQGAQDAFHIQPHAKLRGEVVKKGNASGYFSCDQRRMLLSASVRAPLFTEVVAYLEKEEK